MSSSVTLISLFKPFKWSVGVTFGLLSFENIITIVTPLLLGLAIDGLLGGKIEPAMILAGVLFLGLIIGTGRRLYDTRCYSRIYATLASENAINGWKKNLPVSALSARTEQISEIVDFVETEMVMSYNAIIKVIGALVMLSIADIRLLWAAAAVSIFVALIYAFSSSSIYRLNKGLNDRLDKQVLRLEEKNPNGVKSHFRTLARWHVRLSDLEAVNYALVDLIMIALVVFALWVTATTGNPTPGTVFAVLVYVLEFSEGLIMLPMAFQQFVRLKEITSRLTLSDDETEKST